MRLPDYIRPFITCRHRSTLMAEFFSILAQGNRAGQPLDETLAAIQKETLKWRRRNLWPLYVPLIVVALGICAGILIAVCEAVFPSFVCVLNLFSGMLGLLLPLWLFAQGRAHHDSYMGVLAKRLRRTIAQGHTLSEAMQRHAGWFEQHEIVMVQVGESAGQLGKALQNLASYEQNRLALTPQRNYFLYLVVLAGLYCTVLGGILIFIMPKFLDIFLQMGMRMPGCTQTLMNASDIIAHNPLTLVIPIFWPIFPVLLLPFSGSRLGSAAYFLFFFAVYATQLVTLAVKIAEGCRFYPVLMAIVLVVLALGVAFALALALYRLTGVLLRKGFAIFSPLIERLPFLNRLSRPLGLARFLFSLGALLQVRLPLPAALELAGASSGVAPVRLACHRMSQRVQQGQTLTNAMESEPYFPERTRRLLRLSEINETLPERCQEMAEDAHEDAQHLACRVTAIAGPVGNLLMGAVALFILVSLYLPLFTLPMGIVPWADEMPASSVERFFR